MQYLKQRRGIQQCLHGLWAYNLGRQMGQGCSVAAWDDTWRMQMKCAFPGQRQLRVAVFVFYNTFRRQKIERECIYQLKKGPGAQPLQAASHVGFCRRRLRGHIKV